MINQELMEKVREERQQRRREAFERVKRGELLKAPLWKEDYILGYAFCCPDCKRAAWGSGTCKCGTEICFDLPHVYYTGRIKWE